MTPRRPTAFGVTDWWLMVGLGLLAAWPRFWDLAAVGLTHFDEGAFALSAQAIAQWDLPGGLYPLQHFLSPPLFFGLGGVSMAVFGVSDQVMLCLSAVFGTLTVPLLFTLGRHWNGRAAGASAALLLALSGFHVTYSRVGLTDAAFLFFFLAALYLYTLAEDRESGGFAVLAGLAVGLAWNTKYHGWLAAAIAFAALGLSVFAGERARLGRGLRRWGVSVVVAGLVYLPWAIWVMSQPGGYARLTAEHTKFLGDAANFAGHIVRHFRAQLILETWVATAAPALALGAAWLLVARGRRNAALVWLVPLLVGAFAVGETGVVAVLACAGAVVALRSGSHGCRVQLVALAVFTVLTPLYFPYSRLLLPWAALAFAVAGAGLASLVGPVKLRRRPMVHVTFWVAVAVAWSLASGLPTPARGARPSPAGFGPVAAALDPPPDGAPYWVIGEPGAVFYLRARGVDARHVDSLQEVVVDHEPGDVLWVVAGYYARRTGELERWRQQHGGEIAARSASGVVGDVRLLDDLRSGETWSREKGRRDYGLEVARLVVPP